MESFNPQLALYGNKNYSTITNTVLPQYLMSAMGWFPLDNLSYIMSLPSVVAQLRMLAFIKTRNKKTNHVAR